MRASYVMRPRSELHCVRRLSRGESEPEETESIELVRWPVAEMERRLDELEDAKTLAGLLLYLRRGGR